MPSSGWYKLLYDITNKILMIKIIIIKLNTSHCHIFCRRCVSTNACQILYICNDILEYFLCMVQLFQNLFKINQEPSIEYISIFIEICIFQIIVMYFNISQLKLNFCTAWFVPAAQLTGKWLTGSVLSAYISFRVL